MANINYDKHIWEGWTVGDFIEELQPQLDYLMQQRDWDGNRPIETKAGMRDWCKDNQPYYKKAIPDVSNYFIARYGITKTK